MDTKYMNRICAVILLFITVLFSNTACLFQGSKHEWKPIKQTQGPIVHMVQWQNETLLIISKWYTGNSENWEAIADANPNINPDSLAIGMKIFIPRDLAILRDPMPNKFITSFYKKPIKKSEAPKKDISKNIRFKKQSESTVMNKTDDILINEDDFEVFEPK